MDSLPHIFGDHAAHEGDSALYCRLAASAMDVNEMCQGMKGQLERIGVLVASAMLDIEQRFESHHITEEQRDRLMTLLKLGIDEEEPTEDNNLPVYKLHFPSSDYRRPTA